MSDVHIFVTYAQPATRYKVELAGRTRIFRNKPRALARCRKCKKLRWCQNMLIQVYYDGHYYWCKQGHGCKA